MIELVELDQFVEQNLLALDCDTNRIGSSGYGYTEELPGADDEPERVLPRNIWGCCEPLDRNLRKISMSPWNDAE